MGGRVAKPMPSKTPASQGRDASSEAHMYRMMMVTAMTWAVNQTWPITEL